MRPDQTLTCPHCEEDFELSDSAWHVCLTCGRIYPPGSEDRIHGPHPGEGDVFAECGTSLRVYSERDALLKQREVRQKDRIIDEFEEQGLTVPWERDDFDEAWTP